MFFATPYALFGAFAAAGLLVVYLYRAKFRRRRVSSLMLWRFARSAAGGGRRRDMLRTPLLFYVELAVLLLLAVAALSPLAHVGERAPATIVLDTSASMSAAGPDGLTPAQRASAFLAAEFRRQKISKMKVVAAPVGGPVVHGVEKADAVRLGGAAYGDFASPGDSLPETVAAARRLTPPGGAVYVVTDHPAPTEAEGAKGVDWLAFGRPVANDAITYAKLSRTSPRAEAGFSLYVEMSRFPAGKSTPINFTVSYARADGGRITEKHSAEPNAGGRARFAVSLPSGTEGEVVVRLASADALAADNSAVLHAEPPRKLKVAVALADPGLSNVVERALVSSGYSLERVAPPALPPAENGAALFADAARPAAGNCLQVVFVQAENPTVSAGPFLADASSPLLEGLDFTGLAWPVGTNAPPGRAVLFADGSPLVTVAPPLRSPTVFVVAGTARDAFFRSTAWPAFVWNVLGEAAKLAPGAETAAQHAAPWRFPESEADLTTAGEGVSPAKAQEGASAPGMLPLAPWLGLAALVALAVHQGLSRRLARNEEGGLLQ